MALQAKPSYSPLTPHDDNAISHAEIRRSIVIFEAQIKGLQVQLARQRALLSSNNILPVEILSHVLSFYFNSIPDDPLNHPNRYAPLAACRYWRQAALSTTACWTTLDFTARWNSPARPRSDKDILRDMRTRLLNQFERSGNRQLDLVIRYAEPMFDFFGGREHDMSRNERVAGIAEVLSTSAHRFRSFAEFGISSLSPEDCFFSKTFNGIQSGLLTRLRVRALGTQQLSFPNLELLFVDGFVKLTSLANLDSPNLQSLLVGGSIQLGRREVGLFPKILQHFPRLQKITLICNASLLDAEVRHPAVKELRFHESIYPHSHDVPDSIRSLEAVCDFLQTFPNVDTLTFSSSIIYIYEDCFMDFRRAERIQNLNFEGSIDFGWKSTIDAFSAFSDVTHMKLDHSKASSVYEWDKGRGSGNTFLFELLGEIRSEEHGDSTKRRVARWPKLERLELVGVCLDQSSLKHLLAAVNIRSEIQEGSKSCLLTLRQCSLSSSGLVKLLPDVEGLSWREGKEMFQHLQAEMTKTAEHCF